MPVWWEYLHNVFETTTMFIGSHYYLMSLAPTILRILVYRKPQIFTNTVSHHSKINNQ